MLNRRNLTIAGILAALSTLTLMGSWSCSFQLSPPAPKVAAYGWVPPDEATRAAAAAMPPFRITGAWQDNERANVRLYKFALAINDGKHLPYYPQEFNDCTSFGARHAIHYLQCAQIASGALEEFQPVSSMFIFSAARNVNPAQRWPCAMQGCSGYDTARACRDVGLVQENMPGVPPYDGRTAQQWSCRRPPAELLDAAQAYRIETFALVETLDQARASICNGYPFTVASNWGTNNYDRIAGRIVARGDGSWPHQMACIAYDGETGQEPYWLIHNSHPLSVTPAPLGDEPPGTFWVRNRDMQQMLRERDCYSYSNFKGFPARNLEEFKLFSKAKGPGHERLARRAERAPAADLRRLAL